MAQLLNRTAAGLDPSNAERRARQLRGEEALDRQRIDSNLFPQDIWKLIINHADTPIERLRARLALHLLEARVE